MERLAAMPVRIDQAPHIDGNLDEAVWQRALPATDFIQRDPQEGSPATEQTEIHVLYDDQAIYFGCIPKKKWCIAVLPTTTTSYTLF